MAPTTRSKTADQQKVAKKQGLDASNIVSEGSKRNAQPPDRLDAPPQLKKDRLGNKVFLPGSAAVSTTRIKVDGDSMKDIEKYNERTGGAAGRGSGMTLHHHADLDPKTNQSTASLVPTALHQGLPHIGSSALQRSRQHGGDPDKQAKYGTTGTTQ